jgi:hypothetical protein
LPRCDLLFLFSNSLVVIAHHLTPETRNQFVRSFSIVNSRFNRVIGGTLRGVETAFKEKLFPAPLI